MRILKTIIEVILVSLLLSITSGTVKACSCTGSGQILKLRLIQGVVDPAYKDFATYYEGTIFLGRVIGRKKLKRSDIDWYHYRVTFKVERYWKGADSPEIVVFTGIGGGDCGIPFRKGENYIVFATVLNDRLTTGGCSLTTGAKFAPNIVKGLYLGEGKIPRPIMQ